MKTMFFLFANIIDLLIPHELLFETVLFRKNAFSLLPVCLQCVIIVTVAYYMMFTGRSVYYIISWFIRKSESLEYSEQNCRPGDRVVHYYILHVASSSSSSSSGSMVRKIIKKFIYSKTLKPRPLNTAKYYCNV